MNTNLTQLTDRELTERAAKAAGIKEYRVGDAVYPHEHIWNPLTDDGDALRLAVKLNLSIHQHQHRDGWVDVGIAKELTGTDAAAATRRAIVRAAASLQ
jgi:hypothetical protein